MSGWFSDRILQIDRDRIPKDVRRFTTADLTLGRGNIKVDGKGWRIDALGDQVVRLFEVPDPQVGGHVLTYRASMKSEGLTDRAYLEIRCRMRDGGEFFTRSSRRPLKGTTDWASYETVFRLKRGEHPDLIKLNLVIEGCGKIWLKDLELLKVLR